MVDADGRVLRGRSLRPAAAVGGSEHQQAESVPAEEVLDVVAELGPMASMHAALDRLGIGLACGMMALFEGCDAARLEQAMAAVRHDFPILQMRLAWRDERPVLHPAAADAAAGDIASLEFSGAGAAAWRYEIQACPQGCWFKAVFAHAVADGLSMLRLLSALGAAVQGGGVPAFSIRPAAPLRRMPKWLWTARFLRNQIRRYERLTAGERAAMPGVAWVNLDAGARDALLDQARAQETGMAALLAAAAASSFCERPERRAGRRTVHLNIPIARGVAGRFALFNADARSLLLPVRVRAAESVPALARRISRRVAKMAAQGWDFHFADFLGPDPARHMRFAKIEARLGLDPFITVSWKGIWPQIGGTDGVRHAACFGLAPVLHVSAHADASGLSLSVTSWQMPAARAGLLRRMLAMLGVEEFGEVRAL